MTKPKYFSIIIPLFNKFNFLQKSIYSVLQQTYPYFELIIIDDGSTDGSSELVEGITDKRIRLIKQTNEGVSSARNHGISVAKNELLAFLDADDWWDSRYLEYMQNLIVKYTNESLFCSRFATILHGNVIPGHRFFDSIIKDTTFDLLELAVVKNKLNLPLNSSNFIIRKSILKKSGIFDIRIKYYEDYDFFIRISLHSKVAFLNSEPLSFYSQDIPNNNRATGSVPPINVHFVYYLEKFNSDEDNHQYLKIYLDRFKLWRLIPYRGVAGLQEEVNRIKSTVSLKNYSYKYFILYNIPKSTGLLLISINSNLSKLINKLKLRFKQRKL